MIVTLTQLNRNNLNLVVWLVRLGIRLGVANVLNHLHALESAPENGVLVVQPGLHKL